MSAYKREPIYPKLRIVCKCIRNNKRINNEINKNIVGGYHNAELTVEGEQRFRKSAD